MSIKSLSLNSIKTLFAKHKKKIDDTYARVTRDLTLFVAKGGNDETGDGTEEKPFATLPRAIKELGNCSNDCTIYIKPGEYVFPEGEGMVIPSGINRLSILAYNNDRTSVILSFSGNLETAITVNSFVGFTYITIRFYPSLDSPTSSTGGPRVFANSGYYVTRCNFEIGNNPKTHVFACYGGVAKASDCNVTYYINTEYAAISVFGGVLALRNIQVKSSDNEFFPKWGNFADYVGMILKHDVNWNATEYEDYIRNGIITSCD